MNKLSKFSVDNPVLVNLIMLGILVFGIGWALPGLPRELMPNMSLNWAFVVVVYPGVSPEEIEQYITIPIEDEIHDVDGIESITSASSEGLCQISVKFETMPDDEFDKRFQDLESRVNAIRDLPQDAEDPIILDFTTEEFMPMVSVIISGDLPEDEMKKHAEDIEELISDIDGIAKADIYGAREREIWVEIDAQKLEFYGLAIEQVVAALAAQNVSITGGRVDVGREEYILRTVGQFEDVEEIGSVIVTSIPTGARVTVGDVANIRDTFERRNTTSRFNDRKSMTISTSKKASGNTIELIEQIRKIADDYRALLPPGVEVSISGDTGVLIHEVLRTLTNNAYFGMILVIVILTIVMGWRNAMFAALGIPISFLLTFIFLWYIGESFNGNSLFGLVLVLGVVVDDAIIIIENSYRHMQRGLSSRDAAKFGTAEVMGPVFAATATTIAAFLPLMFVPGIIGKFMRIVPIAVSLTLLASLFEAFIILPSHFAEWSGRLRPERKRPGKLMRKFRFRYIRLLKFTLRSRYLAVISVVAMFCVAAIFVFAVTGVELFREDEMDVMLVWITMPPGTRIEVTDEVVEKVERLAWKLPVGEVESVIGTGGIVQTDTDWLRRTNVGPVTINLHEKKKRRYSGPELRAMMDKILQPEIAGADKVEVGMINTGPPVGKPIEFMVKGRYFDDLEAICEELKDSLATVPGVYAIGDNYEPGKRELVANVDIEKASMLGLDVRTVAATMGTAFEGTVATVFRDGDEEVDVVVKYDEASRENIMDVENLKIMNRFGELITFKDVAKLESERGVASIQRFDRERNIKITAEIDKSQSTIDVATSKVVEAFKAIQPRYPGYRLDSGGGFKEFSTAFDNILMLFAIGIILIYAILGAQFKSFAQPLIIMFTIPFAFIGAALGLFMSGNPLSIATMYGIVALAGIVVNDSLVLISFINNRREGGAGRLRAVMKAGIIRLRPIILTSVTTVFGLIPMVLGLGGKSLVWSPLANTIVWGLSVSTVMTLFIIPALYLIVSDISLRTGFSRFGQDVPDDSWRRRLFG